MRFAGIWVCAASALALSACHRPTVARQAARPQAAAPAPARLAANDARTLPITAGAAAPPPAAGASPSQAGRPAAPKGRPGHASAPTMHAATHAGSGKTARAAPSRSAASPVSLAANGAGGKFGGPDRTQPASGPSAAAPGAEERAFSAEYDSCMASAKGFTVARASCHNAELARQSARVERALNAVLTTRSDDARARLLDDQRAWLERRDADCQGAGGAGASDVLHEGSCRIDMTIRRAVRLERMAG